MKNKTRDYKTQNRSRTHLAFEIYMLEQNIETIRGNLVKEVFELMVKTNANPSYNFQKLIEFHNNICKITETLGKELEENRNANLTKISEICDILLEIYVWIEPYQEHLITKAYMHETERHMKDPIFKLFAGEKAKKAIEDYKRIVGNNEEIQIQSQEEIIEKKLSKILSIKRGE